MNNLEDDADIRNAKTENNEAMGDSSQNDTPLRRSRTSIERFKMPSSSALRRSQRRNVAPLYGYAEEDSWILGGGPEAIGYPTRRSHRRINLTIEQENDRNHVTTDEEIAFSRRVTRSLRNGSQENIGGSKDDNVDVEGETREMDEEDEENAENEEDGNNSDGDSEVRTLVCYLFIGYLAVVDDLNTILIWVS